MGNNPAMKQIRASAGSGKTYCLKQQFLSMLSGCEQGPRRAACGLRADTTPDWRGIMAITFTNAAATEMQQRVLDQLKQDALSGDKEKARAARAWIERVIHDMGSLNISTIDSLLNLILRMSALALDLPPDFTPVFSSGDILEPCLERVMNRAWQGDKDLKRLIENICDVSVRHGDWKGFHAHDILAARMGELLPLCLRGELETLTDLDTLLDDRRNGDGLLPKLRRDIFEMVDTLWQHCCPDIPTRIVMDGRFLNSLRKLRETLASALGEEVDSCRPAAKHSLAEYAGMRLHDPDKLFGSAYFRPGRPLPVSVSKNKIPVPQGLFPLFGKLCDAMADCKLLERMHGQGRQYMALREMTDVVLADYSRDIEHRGMVLNDVIPHMVRDLLESKDGVPEALCRLGVRLRHFLIDEFQDTSRGHWQALRPLVMEALSTGGSLTWVGDVKQAIYGFRGGDCALFDDIARDAGLTCMLDGEVTREKLSRNWRSRAEIIAFNNALFSPLANPGVAKEVLRATLSKENAELCETVLCSRVRGLEGNGETGSCSGAETLLSHFARLTARAYEEAAQENSPKTETGGQVRLLDVPMAQSGGDDAWEDGETAGDGEERADSPMNAAILDAVLLEDARRRAQGLPRDWSRLLILVRTNRKATEAAQVLSREGIPVITENSLLLGEHPLVVQTVALLRFLCAPEDDVAFWALITGSIMRRSGDDTSRERLDDMLLKLGREPGHMGKEGNVQVPLWLLWKRNCPRAFDVLLKAFMERSGSMTPYEIVAEWYERERVLDRFPDSAHFVRRFLELLNTCQQQGIRSLTDVVEYWDKHGSEEKVPMPRDMNAVRVMTMHSAKGLQAPVVIVPLASTRKGRKGIGVVEYLPRYQPSDCSVTGPIRTLCSRSGPFPALLAQDLQEGFEAINRLYVACTRAEERLYLLQGKKYKGIAKLQEEESQGDGKTLSQLLACAKGTITVQEEEADRLKLDLMIVETAAVIRERHAGHHAEDADGDQTAKPLTPSDPAPSDDAAWLRLSGDSSDRHGGGRWEPMDWVPRMKVHLAYQEEHSPRDIAKDQGTFLHCCMEDLSSLPRAARRPTEIVERRFRTWPWLRCEEFRKQAETELAWFLSQPEAHGWLDNGLPEQSMVWPTGAVTGNGPAGGMTTLRADLLVPGPDGPVVLDYKHGRPDARTRAGYERKMREYLRCLAACGQPGAKGIILYLTTGERHEVGPEGKPGAGTKK